MQLVILAGGKGTRLGFDDIPKPMVKVGSKPNLEHQVELARRYGITEVFLLTGHLASHIFDYFGDGSRFGVNITHVIEPYPLGTAGSLKMLEHVLQDRFLVFYGDVVMDFDLAAFLQFDKQQASLGAAATLLTHPNDHPYDSDLVEADSSHRITAFLSKPHAEGLVYSNLVNAAVYVLSRRVLSHIDYGVSSDFGKDVFPAMLKKGEYLASYRNCEYIKDMGTKDRLPKIVADLESGKVARLHKKNKRPAVFIDRDGVINEYVDNLSSADHFKLLPGVAEAIGLLNKSDFLPIVITNQPMIAKGFLSFEELDRIHKTMETHLGHDRAFVADIFFCPHHPDSGFSGEKPELKIACTCRKPGTGLIEKAAEQYNIDLERSWIVGDTTVDIQTGKNAGLRTILVKTGMSGRDAKFEVKSDFILDDLLDAVQSIVSSEQQKGFS